MKTGSEQLESIKNEMRKTEDMVEEVLKNNVKARNKAIILLFAVWSEQGATIEYEGDPCDLINPETIIRCRRKIQNDKGMYQASEVVEQKREEMQTGIKQWAVEE